ncbi:MAG TPA: sugar O-acetyltransferase [Nitrospira sp.]|nr:sugar O-acetyltransferase [Nitrospira sp.]
MGTKTEKMKMLTGELYRSADAELVAEIRRAQGVLARYNATAEEEAGERVTLLRTLLGSCGDNTVIRPIFACDYGYNIRLGRNTFINYQCVFLDCAPIEIGDDAQIGPAVQLYTAEHPLDAETRRAGLESARPIRIGRDVWIGGGAIVLAGVNVGDECVIGAGSVVVHDVPSGSVVAGNPARVIRTVGGGKNREVPH